jgi:hypothetical protein
VKEECPVKIYTKLAAFANLDFNGDINRIWENTKENIKISEKRRQIITTMPIRFFLLLYYNYISINVHPKSSLL